MHLLHHVFFKNLDHYLTIGTFLHGWYEKKKVAPPPKPTKEEPKKNPKDTAKQEVA